MMYKLLMRYENGYYPLEKKDLEGKRIAFIKVGNNQKGDIILKSKISSLRELGIDYEILHFQREYEASNELLGVVLRELNYDDEILGIDMELPEESEYISVDVLPLLISRNKMLFWVRNDATNTTVEPNWIRDI